MKTSLTVLLSLLIVTIAFGQKKVLDHPDFDIWNTIEGQRISRSGDFVMYSLERGEEDNFLKIRDAQGNLVFEHERGYNGLFSFESDFAVFILKKSLGSCVLAIRHL